MPPPVLSEAEISRQLDIREAAGFIKRYLGSNNFRFTELGGAVVDAPDPLGRDWITRMLEAAAARRQ
jgi:hypothetical protein